MLNAHCSVGAPLCRAGSRHATPRHAHAPRDACCAASTPHRRRDAASWHDWMTGCTVPSTRCRCRGRRDRPRCWRKRFCCCFLSCAASRLRTLCLPLCPGAPGAPSPFSSPKFVPHPSPPYCAPTRPLNPLPCFRGLPSKAPRSAAKSNLALSVFFAAGQGSAALSVVHGVMILS